MQYFNIQVGDIVEYFKEEYQVKDKDEIGRLFMKRLSDGRIDLEKENNKLKEIYANLADTVYTIEEERFIEAANLEYP